MNITTKGMISRGDHDGMKPGGAGWTLASSSEGTPASDLEPSQEPGHHVINGS